MQAESVTPIMIKAHRFEQPNPMRQSAKYCSPFPLMRQDEKGAGYLEGYDMLLEGYSPISSFIIVLEVAAMPVMTGHSQEVRN